MFAITVIVLLYCWCDDVIKGNSWWGLPLTWLTSFAVFLVGEALYKAVKTARARVVQRRYIDGIEAERRDAITK